MRELFQIALETYAFLTLHHLTGDQVHSPQWREASSMSCGQDRLRSDSQDRFRSDSQDEPISPFNDQFRNDSQDQYRSNIQDHFTSRTYDGTWSHSLELSMGRYPNLFGSDSQGPFTDPSYELLLRSDSQDQFMSNSQDQFRSDSQDSRFLCVKKLTGILREVCGTIDYEDRVALRWPAVVAGVALAEGGEDDRALVVEILTSMKSQLPNWGALWCLDKLKVFWESGKTEWEDCFDEPVSYLALEERLLLHFHFTQKFQLCNTSRLPSNTMRIFTPAFMAVCAAVSVVSVPDATFALNAVPSNGTRMNLVTAYARVYRKYNVALPASLSAALRLQDQPQLAARGGHESGASAASPSTFTDGQYVIAVDIGTPPRRFHLNLDTASSDAWVYGSAIPAPLLLGQKQYDPARSRTSRLQLLDLWVAGYINWSFVGGFVCKDTLTVVTEQGTGEGLTVEGQGVQVAVLAARSIVEDAGMDGILGLGFDKLNFAFPTKQKTWFSNIRDRLNERLFTVDFRRRAVGKYTFGYIDKDVGPITYTSVNSSAGYWAWTSPGYAVGPGPWKARALQGTLDTGTPIIIMPSDVVADYYSGVAGARHSNAEQGYVFPCNATLPDFTFGVGNTTQHPSITVPGKYLNAATADVDGAPGTCIGALQAGVGDLVVFGAPALQAGVAVFDAGSLRIGWANKTLI
ncbi:endothiapepsin precursor [Cordyceps fumosorosea ARSEF 2679]|uniref:Endothiapepsin n=1 Tax=Cordyceps fumosorosea (strain ARSEF 2679) TaxID=1081104 RepID=A0A167WH78_CORFA|nr:endothiapepsin precursor [Cordyceps fumosorosea ARSEF 2679]OAA63786.1 endothiapepsin precursor [Cordyceps fumosorosea ARSEF 2679]